MVALTGYSIADYLVNRGLVTYAEIAQGGWTVRDNPYRNTRNSNFIVELTTQHRSFKYFIKQVRSTDYYRDRLGNDVDFYRLINQHYPDLRPHVLQVVGIGPEKDSGRPDYDSVNGVLIVHFLENTTSYVTYLEKLRNFGRIQLAIEQLGTVIGRFHHQLNGLKGQRTLLENRWQGRHLDAYCPPLLRFGPWEISRLLGSEKKTLNLLGRLLDSEKETLHQLQKSWKISHLIHADTKFTNFLVRPQDQAIWYIDWEFLAWGDPLWDLASIARELIESALRSMPLIDPEGDLTGALNQLIDGYKKVGGTFNRKQLFSYVGILFLQDYYQWALQNTSEGRYYYENKFRLGQVYLKNPLISAENLLQTLRLWQQKSALAQLAIL